MADNQHEMANAHKVPRVKLWLRGVLLPLVVIALVLPFEASASAAAPNKSTTQTQQSNVQKKISALKDQLNEVSADEADLLDRLDGINNRKADAESKVQGVQDQINALQTQLDQANAKLRDIEAKTIKAQADLQAAQDQLAISKKRMAKQAVDAYVGEEVTSNVASVLLKTDDMRSVSAASVYTAQVAAEKRAIVEQHKVLEAQAKDLKNQIDAKRAEAIALRDGIATQQNGLNDQKQQLQVAVDQVAAEADAQNKLLAEVESKRSAIMDQMGVLQAQSDSIANQLRSFDTGTTPPPVGNGMLANPVPGAPMTSPFGMRLHPILGTYTMHNGQDFGAPAGTPIHAAADGTVVSAGPVSGYGNYTCISHGGGLATCYAHQSKMMVSAGQHVARNQVIGLVGSTGYSTGPHLHFEVRVNGTPVNPVPYL